MKRNNLKGCRKLRKNQTDAESKLWSVLRNRQLCGVKFRRQFSMDKYIVDFYCPGYKLAIEADGGGHYEDRGIEKDEIRRRELNKYGIKILRFSDTDILCDIGGVCEGILREIENRTPHLNPLPFGEREG